MQRHRFTKDWDDIVYKGTGKAKREVSRQEYRAGVSYLISADVHKRAQADGAFDKDKASGPAPTLTLPAEEIKAMKKADLVEFVLNGGATDTTVAETLQAQLDEANASIKEFETAAETDQAEIDALLAAFNEGAEDGQTVETLADVTAAIKLAREAAE